MAADGQRFGVQSRSETDFTLPVPGPVATERSVGQHEYWPSSNNSADNINDEM